MRRAIRETIEHFLAPGIKLKRWLFLTLISTILGVITLELYIFNIADLRLLWGILLLASITGIIFGYYNLFQILSENFLSRLEQLYTESIRSQAPKIVAIGGGTGLSSLLRGLKRVTPNLTAVTTVTDDGGSTGKLIREIEELVPIGDIRNCITALSDDDTKLKQLLNFRFEGIEGLSGHALGNLILVALYFLNGANLSLALRDAMSIFKTKGKVLPSSYQRGTLVAQLSNGRVVKGETSITKEVKEKNLRIRKLWIEPRLSANPEALEAIREADIIVLGPGSLYSSIISNLLIDELAESLRNSKAIKVFILNLVTQPGETLNMTAKEHLEEVINYLGDKPDIVIANSRKLPEDILEKYKSEGASQLEIDDLRGYLETQGINLIAEDLLDTSENLARHSPDKIVRVFSRIFSEYMRK